MQMHPAIRMLAIKTYITLRRVWERKNFQSEYSQFSWYDDLTIPLNPQKYHEYLAYQKIYLKLSNPKNIPILYLDFKKKKCIEMTPKNNQAL